MPECKRTGTVGWGAGRSGGGLVFLIILCNAPSLALSDDWLGARPLDENLALAGVTRFASEIEAESVATKDGPVPVANVLAFDAPRTPQS